MPTVLLVVGLVLIVAGAVVMFLPPPEPEAVAQGVGDEIAKVLEKVNELFDRFDKRFRPGILLMLVGLVLVGVGAWLESHDAANAAEGTMLLIGSPRLLGLRRI
jgi:uncharacterized membrane protein